MRKIILIFLGGLLVLGTLLLGVRLARRRVPGTAAGTEEPPTATSPIPIPDIAPAAPPPATLSDGSAAAGAPTALPSSAPTVVLLVPLAEAGQRPTSATAELIGGPYLGEVTGTTAVVSWVTRQAGSFVVRYGQADGDRLQAGAASTPSPAGYWHSATLMGLRPATVCRYAVYAGEGVAISPEITFTTTPPSGADKFTFVVLGVSRPGNRLTAEPIAGARRVAAQVAQQPCAFVLHTGDMVADGGECGGNLSGWEQYLRAYLNLYGETVGRAPFYVVPGNHEFGGGTCGYEIYTGVYALPRNAPAGDQEEYYSFDWGNAHIVALDSYQGGAPGSVQYNWLERDLQATAQRWKFVLFHYPAYSSGDNGPSAEAQENWVPLFEKYGVDVVFNGHDHIYERTCPLLKGVCTTVDNGGVVYFVTGGAGAVLYDTKGGWFSQARASVNHFLSVQVSGCRLEVQAVDGDGRVIDRYELECSEE